VTARDDEGMMADHGELTTDVQGGAAHPSPSSGAFVARVTAHARVGPEVAELAADAVLQALGERISAGQVADLAALLPHELAAALKRGNARSKGEIRPLSLHEFTRLVSDLEGVPPEEAREHARAVFAALRERVTDKEFADTVAQLPAEYRVLFDEEAGEDHAPAPTPTAPAQTHSDAPEPLSLHIHAPEDLPRDQLDAIRAELASVQGYVSRPIAEARLTLRHPETRKVRSRWVADAGLELDGRPLAAHATGGDALSATEAVTDRLRRQLRRTVGRDVALRNEPRVIEEALEELAHEAVNRPEPQPARGGGRRTVHRRTVPDARTSILDAVTELLDADQEFRFFRHDGTGEWLVAHRRADGRVGLIHPPWVPVADRLPDTIVGEPARNPGPMSLEGAEAELTSSGERFLPFVDAADERPKVLYLRHDGGYGLLEPET
jgi:uncharacterized protein (DUF2267 family)/ribosome-associated translation inhibitor RaiA